MDESWSIRGLANTISEIDDDLHLMRSLEDLDRVSSNGSTKSSEDPPFLPDVDDEAELDFTVECADGCLLVQSSLLAEWSPYFRALLDASMAESRTRSVRFNSIGLTDMTNLVRYIRGRKIDVDLEQALNLLIASKYLLISKLMRWCLKRIQTELAPDNVMEVYRIANSYCLQDLHEVTMNFVQKNLASLANSRQFLQDVDATFMRTLLKSDSLVVPDEDFVLDFLLSWLDARQPYRQRFVDEFKTLIRFPLLRHSTIPRFEAVFGPISDLTKLQVDFANESTVVRANSFVDLVLRQPLRAVSRLITRMKKSISIFGRETESDIHRWNLDTPLLRRRDYTNVHCHIVWQEEKSEDPKHGSQRLVLTCNCLGKSQEVLSVGKWGYRHSLYELEVSGHTMYARSARCVHSFYAMPRRGRALLRPRQIHRVQPVHSEHPFQLRATLDGNLRMISSASVPRIHILNTTSGRFHSRRDSQTMRGSPSWRWSDRLVFDEFNRTILDPISGRFEQPPGPPNTDDFTRWYCATQRGRTLFLWHGSYRTARDFMSMLDLTTGVWGRSVEVRDQRLSLCHTYPAVLQGKVHTLIESCRYGRSKKSQKLMIDQLDEENSVFERVDELPYDNGRFVGFAPVDSAPPCPMDTWLAVELRKMPDATAKQRALIERLRESAL